MTLKPTVSGREFVIASGHPLASMAGVEIMRSGGNAIDAGVAAGIAMGVLESALVSFGGVAPIILYSAEHDEMVTISGLGTWPKEVDRDYFKREHHGRIPIGILRTIVPSAPDAWITALSRYGRMGFADVASFAIDYARNGFRTYDFFRELIVGKLENFSRFPGTADIYLPGGEPPAVGEQFYQTALADSIEFLADEDRAAAGKGGREAGLRAARDAFYKCDMAREMVDHVREQGGKLSLDDLGSFSVDVEPPARITFGDWQVNGCGPWCQGPMLLQALKIVEGYDLHALGHNSPDYVHVLCEALKLAASDRDRYYGDPKFVDVPMEMLLSDGRAAELRKLLRMERAIVGAEDLPEAELGNDESKMDTSYVCVTDAAGNAFSATPSDAPHHAPVSPKLGFVISARGSQSWADPRHPSGVAPGKRPRLTPNPAMAVGPESRMIPFGSPGGDVQTQAMLQAFLNRAVFGFEPQQAVELPRFATYDFPSSWEPHERLSGVLKIEALLHDEVWAELTARGHRITEWPDLTWPAGSVSLIDFDCKSGRMVAGSDPRREAQAIGR